MLCQDTDCLTRAKALLLPNVIRWQITSHLSDVVYWQSMCQTIVPSMAHPEIL